MMIEHSGENYQFINQFLFRLINYCRTLSILFDAYKTTK